MAWVYSTLKTIKQYILKLLNNNWGFLAFLACGDVPLNCCLTIKKFSNCTATRNSGHSLRQDCSIILIYLKGVCDGGPNENEETSPPSSKPKFCLRLSAVKVHKQNCVANTTSAMKTTNFSVSVKRVCQTTNSVEGVRSWGNRLENLDVSRCDQGWVGDITYVHLKGHFIYVCLLMDVFTRMIRAWRTSEPAFDAISDVETLGRGFLTPKCPRDPSFRSRRAVSFKCVYLTASAPWH